MVGTLQLLVPGVVSDMDAEAGYWIRSTPESWILDPPSDLREAYYFPRTDDEFFLILCGADRTQIFDRRASGV